MSKKESDDLVINGSMKVPGGTFHSVKIAGSAKITNDIVCKEFTCAGHATVEGYVESESFVVRGNSSIHGNVESQIMKISGNTKVNGQVKGQEINIDGSILVEGSCHGEEMKVRGYAKITGDCEAESFQTYGCFQIEGLLNAGRIYVQPSGECRAKEIGGEHIEVRRRASFLPSLLRPFFSNCLTTHIIEGDDIYLEDTKAAIVRGNHITLGPGCNIQLVEYKTSLICDDKASVKEKVKQQ